MEQNELYPIFLKVTQLQVLIIGGGNVGLEKLTFLLKSSPNAHVTVVSLTFLPELVALAKSHKVHLVEDSYNDSFLMGKHMVIATTDKIDVNIQVYKDCKDRNILINVADNPPYCDFYMGGIVTKGNIKIAISTNGKSPTLAKRLRQFFEEVIPNDIDDLAKNLNKFRKTIKGDFSNKVAEMNKLTEKLL
ncbi:bifunctional precorrin-2 dehydrogenase/sirohydrochlorin ferrochelatase [Lutibacter sp.]|uniref:precorrin-2 dehydrogenase/sirohydrochlorin ferrochelatase family protein n=1 Tax=Lutibacter sp. TaxID=1925666 RepID=UPI001A2FD3FE|nr:bifunctional precorrin-2 dehydrogenase/sirohydrochlorin ferrochelatase [Lutibacter sp.]MBI9041522.1 bifunctional precorrin-2 dehydrogenase/sirohydrochlorin ferrochelatase [Lutibacter sp.]